MKASSGNRTLLPTLFVMLAIMAGRAVEQSMGELLTPHLREGGTFAAIPVMATVLWICLYAVTRLRRLEGGAATSANR